MLSLIKKELLQFFGSLIAYMILVVFALISGLFLWFFEGNMNILSGGYASLTSFFDLVPWLYLFLIPAITMRLISEEIRSGTLELLLTRPVSVFQMIVAKLVAAFVVVLLTMIFSLVYFYTVYQLGNPVGVMDVAASMGSYLGLLFLALIFLSVGLFASSLSENQIVSFVIAVLLSFFLFSGFELLSDLIATTSLSAILLTMGVSSHYESISRGMLDSRDFFYFVTITLLFLFLTVLSLRWRRKFSSFQLKGVLPYLVVFTLLVVLTQARLFRIDFTSERRYTLSAASVGVLEKLDHPLLAEIYLEGDMPPGFRRLRTAIEEKLYDLQQYGSKSIFVRKVDPYREVSAKERSAYFTKLFQLGIIPSDLRIRTDQGITTKLVFPSVLLRYQERTAVLNLLKNDPSLPAEENLNRSVEMLEYELMNAIRNLTRSNPVGVAFLEGHDEADSIQVHDFSGTLAENFKVSRVNCQQLVKNSDSIKVLVVANPKEKFPEKDKLILDQYLMNGGKMIVLMDPVKVSLDSLSEGMTTMALPQDLNLSDQLFRYGIRMNYDLVQDAECMKIRVNTAPAGASPNYSLAPWYFSPLLHPSQNHPVGKNVNPVSSEFISSMDTVGEDPVMKRTILLRSSAFSRKTDAPLMVNLRMIDAVPSRAFFNRSDLITGILLEGKFTSVFKNRMVDPSALSPGRQFQSESRPTQLAFFSDGGLINNKVNRALKEPKTEPLGYDRVSKITWGNRDLFVNLVQFMADEEALSGLRSKTWQLRLLDKTKISEEGQLISWINLLAPLFLILLGGLVFSAWRKRRYEKRNVKIVQ